ncbi:aminotransferase [Croceicoccus estronivorus]|uniref:cysteine desulfurase family protein n=1 Tax=Croceicoccus estronivorus TaxID=1172626 RepID=UPI00083250C7|nr:cysteine desulfurase family protein [Croceicoccus estronivorus]OCC22681.1 aminotransferase [Croceicoccus estronivorus]
MIYCDYQATTPLAPEAREEMLRWLDGPAGQGFGNPHSPHRLGRMAAAAVELARERVAALCPPGGSVVFTGSATEALNLALRGSTAPGDIRPVAVSAIEHAAVLDTAHALGGPVNVLTVDAAGMVAEEPDLVPDTRLVAVMQVNNEIGTIQPVEAIAAHAKRIGALFVCDAVQGAGKVAPPANAEMIAISAHKLYGPKGIGALWVREGVELAPIVTGGGQEMGLRSGTLSPALCAGFGMAAKLAFEQQEADARHVETLWKRAGELFSGWTLNGSAEMRWHGNLNLRRDGLDVARLMADVRDVAFSAGSACASGSGRPSHVLSAIGLDRKQAKSSIRLGFGRYSTLAEIEEAAEKINAAAQKQE